VIVKDNKKINPIISDDEAKRIKVNLQSTDGKSFGEISASAYSAIRGNYLDKYSPIDDNEKKVLNAFKSWTGYGKTTESVTKQYEANKFGKGNIDLTKRPIFKNEDSTIATVNSMSFNEDGKEILIPKVVKDKNGKAKMLSDDEAIKHYHDTGEYLGKFNSVDEANEYANSLHIDQDLYYANVDADYQDNPVFERYGIDPYYFTYADFEKWAKEHGYEYRMSGNDLTGSKMKWLPKSKNTLKFWEVVPTKQEQEDKKVLEQLYLNNQRAESTNKDKGAVTSAVMGAINGLTLGAIPAVADWDAKRDYKKAGLDIDSFVKPSQASAKTISDHPIAYAVGDIGGSLLAFMAAEELVASGLSKIPKYAKLANEAKGIGEAAKIAQKTKQMIDTVATIGATSAVSSTFQQDWGKDPWYKSVGNIILDTTVSSVGAYLGGKLSAKVGEALLPILKNNTKLSPAAIMALTGSAGALTMAGTITGAAEIKNALYCAANGVEYKPDFKSIATNMAVLTLYAGLKSYVREARGTTAAPTVEEPFKYFTEEDMQNPTALKTKMRQYAKQYHPDLYQTKGAEAVAEADRMFAEINAEYIRAKAKCAFIIAEEIRKPQSNNTETQKASDTPSSDAVSKAVELLNDVYSTDTVQNDSVIPAASVTPQTSQTAPANVQNVQPVQNVPVDTAPANVQNVQPVQNVPVDTAPTTGINPVEAPAEMPQATSTVGEAALTNLADTMEKCNVPVEQRKSILSAVQTLDTSLANSKITTVQAINAITTMTNNITRLYSIGTNESAAYWNIFGANIDVLSMPDNIIGESFLNNYTVACTESLKAKGNAQYTALANQYSGTSFADITVNNEVKKAVLYGTAENSALTTIAKKEQDLIKSASKMIVSAHDVMYDSNHALTKQVEAIQQNDFTTIIGEDSTHDYGTAPNTTPTPAPATEPATTNSTKDITLNRVGDFYEVYGDGAVELANKLNLTPTTKNINGERLQMVGFPVSALDKYKATLGDGYNLNIIESPADTSHTATAKATKAKAIRAKKRDWAAHDVEWYSPNGKTIVAYSTVASKDLIDLLASDNPSMSIAELQGAINYDMEAKKVLQAYIDSGFGDEIASKHFGTDVRPQKPVEESVTKTPESVSKTTESVTKTPENEIKQADSVTKAPKADTPKLTDKCEMHETTHTKTGEKLWVISLKDKITTDKYKELSSIVKKVGGYYSRFAKTPDGKAIPGFIFKSKPDSEVIKVFNDFFGVAEKSTSPDTDMLKKSDDSDIIKEKEVKDGVNNVEQKSELLAGESTTDDSGLHSSAQSSTERTAETDSGQHRDNGRELLQDDNGTEPIRPNVGNDSERVHGRNDAESSDAESGKSETEITDSTSEIIDTEVRAVEKPRPSNKGNFVITDDVAAEIDTTAPSAKDNIEAIELLLKIEDEGRPATAEEKKILAKYKGWGGIDPRYLPYDLSSRFGRLFDWEQRKAMQSSMNNAFFTPTKVIDAMYNGLKRMGFRGGNVLETSMGVGNFFGRMPQALSSKSALTGVELESYTARIAQYLYPGATVINKPFQDVAIKNSSYDLVIGNVPFGTNKLTYNKKKYNLHNYFILSSIDKVRDGGVVAVITSAGTLDSYTLDARKAIMDKADVIGCYKLPAGVFSRNADTDVQTDLIILRKRANSEKPSGDSILNVITNKDGLRINEYFEKHPENVLGVLSKGTNAWGEITTVLDDGSFYDKLETAMKKLPKDLFSGKTELKPIETIVSVSDKPRFFEKNGKIYSDDGAGTATQVTNREQTVRDYMAVRDAYKELLNAYELDKSEEDIKPLRDALSKAYDKFYKAHTAITGDGKKKIGNTKCKNNTFLEADADYYLVSGLEYYNAKDGKFEKSALFEKDTLRKKRVTSVDAASDALAVSLNESGHIDFERMKELTGKTETQLVEELKGEIVLTPEGEYVLTDIYLSGNIYEKLEAVKGKSEFKEQQAMLEAVLPTPKDASSITVKLGANYIEPSYTQDFVADIFKTRIEVSKDNSGRWSIEGVRQIRYGDILNVKYGCKAFNAIQLLEKILNDSEITATKRMSDGTKLISVFDSEQTEIARQKAEDIKAEFESWIFSDSDRRADIVDRYNRTYNNYRPLDYEHIAEKLSFDSMDSTLKAKLYPHQKKGIARFLFGGNILFAHGVGTGKTFEMIASVMEAKRMGLINKAAMVVPNNKVVDFKRDIAQAYPNAKVLVIDTANKKRQTMLGLVNSNDWDIVLIARTTFTKIPVSNELQANYVNQQLEDLEYQISLAQSDRDVSKRQLKGLITQRDNLEQKLKDLNSDTVRDENSVEFEKLGIDCICVDEAHNYKSILTPTKLDIKGLVNRNNAQMANDMLMKLDYMRSIDGKIVFGTGTPITNTVSEIYNMMRMVRPDILEDAGIHSLDEWVNTFAKIETNTEIGIDNKIKTKSTQIIKNFVNGSEMFGMFRQFADIVFTDDVVKNLPKAIYKDVKLDSTAEHRQIEEEISSIIANTPKSELLKTYGQLMSMADAASVDLRMLSGAESEHNIFKDYSLDELDYADSKINTMCGLVFDEYKASKDIKGTQIIFCDKGSGSGTVYSFNLHKDIMKKLIEKGIPKDEIVIVKDQSDSQLEALYEKVNNGEVRVLIGTSQKMAEGLNVQKRVVAIHHPTVTYKPSDWEQGNARGIRAGNINPEVRIYRYLQENTFDSHKWQAVDRKGEMIRRALRGEQIAEMEDIGADDDSGAGVDAATAMAITSGNPLVKEKIDIDKEVIRLKTLERNYKSEMYRYKDAIAKNPGIISRLTTYLDRLAQDIALRDKYGEKAEMVIKGKKFDKQGEANMALGEAVKSAPKNGNFTKLGEYNGFDIMFKGDTGGIGYTLVIKGANEYTVEYAGGSGNNIARIAGVLNRLTAEQTKQQARLEQLQKDLEFAKTEVNKPFEKEAELSAALEKQKDITYRYEHYSEQKQSEPTETDTTSDDEVLSSRDLNLSEDTVLENRWATERVEDNKVKGVNIADIVRSISEKFGIPIATSKVTDREASGIYKAKPETIRTRIANNLPTISHELGHHLCKKYGLDGLESVATLRNSVSQEYLDMYDDDVTKNKESVAEFIRSYLKNTNEAVRLCPEFYAEFIQALSKEDLKTVNKIASAVNAYLSYNISERYDAAITSSQKKEKIPFREKWEKFYTNWVDSFHPQKEAVDYVQDATGRTLSGKGNAYVLATNSLNAHAVANYLVCEGFRNLSGELIDAKSFIDCIGMVDSKDVKLLDKYLVLRHSLEWIAPEQDDVTAKRVFADDTLENVEEIKKQMAKIEDTHPEIKTAAENLYEYQNNVLKHFVIPAGGMTRETLETLNRKYPSYVPFYRAVGNKKSGMAKGTFANQRSPIMRAKGSGAMIISPTESIIRNTEKMVKFALRNQVMRIWANYADNVDGFGQFMEKVSPDMIPHFTDISKQKESFTEALQHKLNAEDYFAVSDMFDEIFGDAVTDFTPIANANKKIVTVLQSGVPSYYQIHDNAFYTSVAELSPQQTSGLLKVMNSVMQPMKLLITQNNPIFAVTNAIRDYGTAYKLSEVNNPVTFAAQYVKALATIIANGESYKQYKAMGGGHSSELSANIKNIKSTLRKVAQKDMGKARRLAYSIFRHPVETVASFNDLIESVPRFAEFQRTLTNGGDLQEAIFNASDLTTNFKRSGSGDTAKAVNKIIMFNNAAIQGLDKAFRTITNKDIKKRYKTLLKWLLNALIMGILGYLYNNEVDEEGYKNLSAYKKNNFYNYALGDGKFISLPKPRENALLDTLTERTFEYLLNENEEAFYDFGTYLGQQLLPPMLPDTIDPVNAAHSVLGSTVLGGLVDVGFNQDFKGTPIEGAYDKYIPSNERYTESTSKVAYALGQTQLARDIDMSPKKIDHLISSYAGILGQVNKALFPINPERKDKSVGLRNKFISDSNYSTDVLNKMYENEEKAEKAFQYAGTIDKAVEYEQNAIITSYISGMNKAIKALPESEQRNGRVYLLQTLNRWDYNNTTSQTNMLSRLDGEKVSDGVIITDLPKSTMEWTVYETNSNGNRIKRADGSYLRTKCEYQMTPQEYDAYIKDYLNLVEKYRTWQGNNISNTADYTAALEETSTEVKKVLNKKYQQKYYGKAQKSVKE